MISKVDYELWAGHKVVLEFEWEKYVPATYNHPAEGGYFALLGVYTLDGEEITDDISESRLSSIEKFVEGGGLREQ